MLDRLRLWLLRSTPSRHARLELFKRGDDAIARVLDRLRLWLLRSTPSRHTRLVLFKGGDGAIALAGMLHQDGALGRRRHVYYARLVLFKRGDGAIALAARARAKHSASRLELGARVEAAEGDVGVAADIFARRGSQHHRARDRSERRAEVHRALEHDHPLILWSHSQVAQEGEIEALVARAGDGHADVGGADS